MTRRRGLHLLAILFTAALLTWAATVLLRSPCVGVADNLDFWRVMRPAGIEHVTPIRRPGAFVQRSYATGRADLASGASSAAVMAWLAKHLPWGLAGAPGRMDLRQVGALYLLVTAAVLALAWAAGVPPLLAAALFFVLADPGYLLFFNSFYADPALFVALFGATLWMLRDRPLRPAARVPPRARAAAAGAALVLLAVLGGGSKMQYTLFPAAVLAALLSLTLCRVDIADDSTGPDAVAPSGRTLRPATVILPGLLLAAAVVLPLHFLYGPAPRFLRVNNYQAVYGGILLVSSRPDRVLQNLGIPAAYGDLPRTDVWSGHVPADHPVFARLQGLSRPRLLGAYLTDPAALRGAADRIEHALGTVSSHTRGNFSRAAGRTHHARFDVPWRFAHLRQLLLGRWPGAVWLLLLGTAGWLTERALRRRWDGPCAAALLLLLFASSQLVVVVLGDGFVALRQHLVGARLALDLLAVLLVWTLVRTAVDRISRWRDRQREVSELHVTPRLSRTGG